MIDPVRNEKVQDGLHSFASSVNVCSIIKRHRSRTGADLQNHEMQKHHSQE